MPILTGRAAVLRYTCLASLLALAACNNAPPPPPQVVEDHTRVVEKPVPVPEPVAQAPTVNIDLVNAHHDDDARRREEEARRHDDHPH